MSCFIALCATLANPANGAVLLSGNSVGDRATYTCHFGYEVVGTASQTCTSDGTWSSDPPICRRK